MVKFLRPNVLFLGLLTVASGSLSYSGVRTNLSAQNQSSTVNDTEITRGIRKALFKDHNLSTYAKNVRIITIESRVTLKGPVKSLDEEKAVLKCARGVHGVAKVTDYLEVAKD